MLHTVNKEKREKLKKIALSGAIIGGLAVIPQVVNAGKWKFNPVTKIPDYIEDSGSGSSTIPGGVDTNIQYNDSGSFGGDSNFTWDKTSQALEIIGKQTIEANADEVQFTVQANPSQTANLIELKNSSGSVRTTFDARGGLIIKDNNIGNGAIFMQVNNQAINASTVTTNIVGITATMDITTPGRPITGIKGIITGRHSSGSQFNPVVGVDCTAQARHTDGIIKTLTGGIFKASQNSTFTVNEAIGGEFTVGGIFGKTGSIIDAIAMDCLVDVDATTITTGTGILLRSFAKSTGTLTNAYGIFLEEQSIGSAINYQIYSEGGESLLISNGASQTPLSLRGNSTQTSNILRVEKSDNSNIFSVDNEGVEMAKSIRTSAVETITAASDTLDNTNYFVRADCTSNTITINLPTASGNTGLTYIIKKVDSTGNQVTIDGNGSETIDGNTTLSIALQYDSFTICSNGTNWDIL